MRFGFFAIPAQTPGPGQEKLNAFCAGHRVVSVEKQFVAQGVDSFWSICVTYVDGTERPASGGRRERIDYKELLDERDFAVYAELRQLRKTLAEQEGVPAYALFTNEQLAEMVTGRVTTQAALGEVNGVGKARLEKYGDAFLDPRSHAPAWECSTDAPASRIGIADRKTQRLTYPANCMFPAPAHQQCIASSTRSHASYDPSAPCPTR